MDSNVQAIIDNIAASPAIEGDNYTIIITDNNLPSPGPIILCVMGDVSGLTGYSADELVGKTPRILQGKDTDKTELRRLRETCERGHYYQGSLINYRKDGTPFLMGLAISPIRVNGNIEYYFAIQSDVTNRDKQQLLDVIRKRIDRVNHALDTASLKLTNSVINIGQLLTLAATRQFPDLIRQTTSTPPPDKPATNTK